jgi:hypothetical protein
MENGREKERLSILPELICMNKIILKRKNRRSSFIDRSSSSSSLLNSNIRVENCGEQE